MYWGYGKDDASVCFTGNGETVIPRMFLGFVCA